MSTGGLRSQKFVFPPKKGNFKSCTFLKCISKFETFHLFNRDFKKKIVENLRFLGKKIKKSPICNGPNTPLHIYYFNGVKSFH